MQKECHVRLQSKKKGAQLHQLASGFYWDFLHSDLKMVFETKLPRLEYIHFNNIIWT